MLNEVAYMKTKILSIFLASIIALSALAGCGAEPETSLPPTASESSSKTVADASDMAEPVDILDENMTPVYADELNDGEYPVNVDCSSSMFKIAECLLKVENGKMTADIVMNSTSYLYLFMGKGEQAAAADESTYIPFVEDENGRNICTVPVEALDSGIDCAAFSRKKEMWYDRILVFRADSLPDDAFKSKTVTTAESLGLSDGSYTVEVTLSGGSGRAGVESPAQLNIKNGEATALIVWSSSKYDYMKVDGVKYDQINKEGNSTFEIPVSGFDFKMPVIGDTTAMSEPHEIEYALTFDSSTITEK